MQRIELRNGDIIIGDIVEVDPSTMVYTIETKDGVIKVIEENIKKIKKDGK